MFLFEEKNFIRMKKLFLLTALLATFTVANAQIKTPAPSPSGKISQEVGLAKVEVDYSRPSAKGRKVFGDLVPFGQMWRTGANASTKITVSEDVKVAGMPLPKGTYALYTIPGEKEWTVIFYKNTSYGGVPDEKDFKEDEVQARVKVSSVPVRDLVETFTIGVGNLRNSGADLEISWEYTKVLVPIMVDTDTKVLKAIETTMSGPSANDYNAAARYYFEEKKDMAQALVWVDKALEKGGEKFWILRLKANILAELGRYKEAIMVAEKSTELAKKDGNEDYPRMNTKSIADWSKKK
jgi:hypothetical protein